MALFASWTSNASQYVSLEQITTAQGLNQSEIIQLMQDAEGALWIAGTQGLNRYDGYRVTTIPSPEDILSSYQVELLFEDSKGLIWIGAIPDKNYVLDKKSNVLKSITLPKTKEDLIGEKSFVSAVEDGDGNIWFSTFREIFFYERRSGTFKLISGIATMMEDKPNQVEHYIRTLLLVDEHLLIATSNQVYALNTETEKSHVLNIVPSDLRNRDNQNTKFLLLNEFGKIFVGTVEGLFEFDKSNISSKTDDYIVTSKNRIADLNIWSMIEKPLYYWLATDQGLYQLSKSGVLKLIFKFSETKFNTGDDNIVTMIEDREGNLWFGSRGDGIFKWHPTTAIKKHLWSRGEQGHQLSHDLVFDIVKTPDQAVWLATENGLNRVDPISGKTSQFLTNPDPKAVMTEASIVEILYNKGKLWLNTNAGLRVFDLDSLKEEKTLLPPELSKKLEKNGFSMAFFDNENLTIFTQDEISKYNLDSNQVVTPAYETKTQKEGEIPFIIFDTPSGESDVAYVAIDKGLAKFNHKTGEITKFHQSKSEKNELIYPMGLHKENGHIWVSYAGLGVFKLDASTGAELEFYSEEALGAYTVMDIFSDKKNNLWFLSNNGLARMNSKTGDTRRYDKSDGFLTSEFNGGSLFKLDNGEVLVGSVKGMFHFSPNDVETKQELRLVTYITELSLLSDPLTYYYGYYEEHQLELDHDDFGLKVEFSPFLLNKPSQIKYQYWIEGDSPLNVTEIDENELFLPAFKPGINTIFISGIDYESGKQIQPAKLTIVTSPPPWLSTFAYFAYVVGLVLFGLSAWMLLRRRQLAKEQAHLQLMRSEERLKLALKGGKSGLWDWHAVDNRVYDPRLNSGDESVEETIFPFQARLEAIHSADRDTFEINWLSFLRNAERSFNQTYRMRLDNTEWAWYRDMATVTQVDENGSPLRITGTYTNITNRKRDRDQMRLYSKAFENTRDIVFVLDEAKSVIAANQALYKSSNLTEAMILNSPVSFLIDTDNNHGFLQQVVQSIELDQHWEGEGYLLRKQKKPLPVLINATQFQSVDNQQHYVFALTDISSQKSAEAELRKLANYDNLTGLPNRALLLDRIKHAIQHCRRRHQSIALFFVDLDRFKRINDTLGHDIGDMLLINVAQILRNSVRQDDTVARLAGDEFVIMLEDIEGIDSINHIAQDVIEKMKQPLLLQENQVSITPSIGIAIYPLDGENGDTLLKHADIAMYHAKKEGRNNFQYYETSMNQAAKKRLLLENKLRQGLEDDEFYLHYQPQFDLMSGNLIGLEALARWRGSDGALIPPSEFIPLAEELGLIIILSEKLLEQAIAALSSWHSRGINIGLAFNLSARHLQHYDLSQFIDQQLLRHPIRTELLEFELTESVLMEDVERAQRLFEALADKGVELALDDFGTGFSSLRYLSQLPIKKLKIDRSFVAQIGKNQEMEAIIQAILTLAKSLNMKTVAEGIETESQALFLKNAGTGCAQGFLFSRPLELEKVESLLLQHVATLN